VRSSTTSLAKQPFLIHNLPYKFHFFGFRKEIYFLFLYRARLSALRLTTKLEVQVSVRKSLSDMVAELYSQAPGSLFVAFCYSQVEVFYPRLYPGLCWDHDSEIMLYYTSVYNWTVFYSGLSSVTWIMFMRGTNNFCKRYIKWTHNENVVFCQPVCSIYDIKRILIKLFKIKFEIPGFQGRKTFMLFFWVATSLAS
jgi:hypothetical protein